VKPKWRRIVIKVGTSTLTCGGDELDPPRMVDLVRQIAELRSRGADVVLVTSGAQQAGRSRLGTSGSGKTIPLKQMLAAVGQGRLMHLWEQYFDLYRIVVAQVLMTRQDTEDRHRYLSLRDTFEQLMERHIVPVVNENDAVATEEIRVGENDTLSAMVASLIEADLLVLLTDIDGLYTCDPTKDPNATLVQRVETIDEAIHSAACGSNSEQGTGGMQTKIVAAEIAGRCGTTVAIANGSRADVLLGLWDEAVPATWFPAPVSAAEGRKRWLVAQSTTSGAVVVDAGAERAIRREGKSLLPVGITSLRGEFGRGAIVSIRSANGDELARGLANYDSRDLRRILGHRSTEVVQLLGYDYGPEFIHRDKMALL